MGEFVNTIDIIGEEAVQDGIIMATLEELKDDRLDEIGTGLFNNFQNLKTLVLPNVTIVRSEGLYNVNALELADFSRLIQIESWSFNGAAKLIALIIRNEEQLVEIGNNVANKLSNMVNGTGFVYVPASLIDSYKAHQYWSEIADSFRALEEYTVDGTVTGDLDETKI